MKAALIPKMRSSLSASAYVVGQQPPPRVWIKLYSLRSSFKNWASTRVKRGSLRCHQTRAKVCTVFIARGCEISVSPGMRSNLMANFVDIVHVFNVRWFVDTAPSIGCLRLVYMCDFFKKCKPAYISRRLTEKKSRGPSFSSFRIGTPRKLN